MMSIKELQDSIEVIRELLTNMIQVKGSLLDPEIVFVSKQLDILLNEYYKLYESTK